MKYFFVLKTIIVFHYLRVIVVVVVDPLARFLRSAQPLTSHPHILIANWLSLQPLRNLQTGILEHGEMDAFNPDQSQEYLA